MNSVVVAANCPSCGAPLDFDEGSNAVKCQHCRSNLLVTGRKQLLSYHVSPKLDEHKAVAMAIMAQRNKGRGEFCGIKAQLYFIPYYRMTGQDFGWQEPPPKPEHQKEDLPGDAETGVFEWPTARGEGPSIFENGPSVLDATGELLGTLFHKIVAIHSETIRDPISEIPEHRSENRPEGIAVPPKAGLADRCAAGGSLYENGKVLLNDRYIEKNFLACALHGVGLYSLGVRPAVLRLELFQTAALKAMGKIVHPAMSADAAEAVGMKTAINSSVLYRQVIGRILSLVYFPFWFVEMESNRVKLVTIIDAVSQSLIKADASTSIYETLDREFHDNPTVIGFRPLTCPNCGWDFPVRPEDSIFSCKTCSRAWHICGSELSEILFQVAAPQNPGEPSQVQYLPFWVLTPGSINSRYSRFFIPAFRYRRLKFLLDLALKISRLQPSFQVLKSKELELYGCYYDAEDAALVAQFTGAALTASSIAEFRANHDLSLSGATLTWFPFQIQGEYLLSPFGKICIPKNLLL